MLQEDRSLKLALLTDYTPLVTEAALETADMFFKMGIKTPNKHTRVEKAEMILNIRKPGKSSYMARRVNLHAPRVLILNFRTRLRSTLFFFRLPWRPRE